MTTIVEAMERFLEHVQASQSYGTARTYKTGLAHFERYLQEQDVAAATCDVAQLDLPLASGFVTWLYNYLLDETADGDPERINQTTKATYFAAISRFFEYLIIESQLVPMTLEAYDTLRKAVSRASKYNSRRELPPDKLPTQAIVDALRQQVHQPLQLPADTSASIRRRKRLIWLRDMAIVEAFLSSGMRVSELTRLRRGDLIHQDRGALLKHTKGNRERQVLFSHAAWDAIQTYLQERQDGAQARILTNLPVFARHDRKAGNKTLPLSTRSVQNIFTKLAEDAGIAAQFHLTPHTLRHFFATEFLSETGNLALTQYALGHASPNTTRIYAQTKRQDFIRAHRQVFDEE